MNLYLRLFLYGLVIGFTATILGGCGSRIESSGSEENIAIQINDRKISLAEFNTQFKNEVHADPEMDQSEESRRGFVEHLIQRELMIQEAIRLKLDHKEEFVSTIQRYWEATLIRDLISRQSERIQEKIFITQEDVLDYYREHREEIGFPLEGVKEDIRSFMESEKLEAALVAWTEELKSTALVRINRSQMR